MSVNIHPTAIVHDNVQLGTNVEIGPYSIIGENVKIGDNTKIYAHVCIDGYTTIGANNQIMQFSSIGAPPQDKSYRGEPTETIIGDHNIFREGCTVHRATTKEDGKTIVGNHGYFMAQVHFAHDTQIGDYVTLANATMCAGHVKIGDYVQMGGACGVTPFCSVGNGVFVGAASAIDKDVPHYTAVLGNRVKMKGVNIIGLKRRGHSKDVISEVIDFYRMMESSALSPKAFIEHPESMEEYKGNSVVQEVAKFINDSKIGLPPFVS